MFVVFRLETLFLGEEAKKPVIPRGVFINQVGE